MLYEYRVPEEDAKRNKRRGPDFWLKFIHWLTIIGWTLLALAFFLALKAKPPARTYFDRKFDVYVRTTWDKDALGIMFFIFILGLIFSVTGLIINFKRMRRKSDRINYSLLFMGVVSFIGIVSYIIAF